MTSSRRYRWLIATTAAVFGLQAPLCAVACLSPRAASDAHAAAPMEHAGSPCHEAAPGPADAAPVDRPSSHDDCGCDDAEPALKSADSPRATSLAAIAAVPPAALRPIAPRAALPARVPHAGDLPPPDILLLTSTLLL